MPKSWRTDTFMSGRPGTPAWAWAGMSLRFRMVVAGARHVHAAGSATRCELPSLAGLRRGRLLQIVIGLDDFAQLVLGPLVAAVGVGMVALHQLLEPRLDLDRGPRRPADRALPATSLQRLQPARSAGASRAAPSASEKNACGSREAHAAASVACRPCRGACRAPWRWRPPSRSAGGRSRRPSGRPRTSALLMPSK